MKTERARHLTLGTRISPGDAKEPTTDHPVFDAQQVLTVPHVKLIRRLGDLPPDQLALVEEAVRPWLEL